jgi:hypothetical protein
MIMVDKCDEVMCVPQSITYCIIYEVTMTIDSIPIYIDAPPLVDITNLLQSVRPVTT